MLTASIISFGLIGQAKPKLTMEQAKEGAELFVKKQGYTNFPLIQDIEILKFRHNMLEASAIGAKAYKNGWIVAFRYSKTYKPNMKMKFDFKRYGRAVTLDIFGDKIQIEHKDIMLEPFQTISCSEKRLHPK
jgi:hypothetical protein